MAELEKRLNELSSHLEVTQSDGSSDRSRSPANSNNKKNPDNLSIKHLFSTATPPSPPPSEREEAKHQRQDGPWPLPREAEILLVQYHDVYAPLFPFVVVVPPPALGDGDGGAAWRLKQQKPILWKAVMMTSCFYDSSRQLRLGYELLTDIVKAAYVDGTHTLDLLQGLLLTIGWFNVALKSAQLTDLLFLARSISVSLSSPAGGCQQQEAGIKPSTPSLDQVRAYAGMYYLNTLQVSSFLFLSS